MLVYESASYFFNTKFSEKSATHCITEWDEMRNLLRDWSWFCQPPWPSCLKAMSKFCYIVSDWFAVEWYFALKWFEGQVVKTHFIPNVDEVSCSGVNFKLNLEHKKRRFLTAVLIILLVHIVGRQIFILAILEVWEFSSNRSCYRLMQKFRTFVRSFFNVVNRLALSRELSGWNSNIWSTFERTVRKNGARKGDEWRVLFE